MKSLTLVRRIAARPSIVFEAMTTAEGVAAWWGPDDLPVLRAEMDARVGGAYRVRFRTRDGRDHEASRRVPGARAAAPHRHELEVGRPAARLEEQGRTSRIEIDLAPIADGTELTFTHADLSSEASAKSHAWGWTGALNKLDRGFERDEARREQDSPRRNE